jgi:hypothetical protein
LFGEYLCIHCFLCSLVSTFINETQVSSPVIHTMWLRNSSQSFRYRSIKRKGKSFSAVCAQPWAFSEPTFRKTCDNLAYLW